MSAWLTVIGLGADGLASLSGEARTHIDAAEVLVGGERHLALVAAPATVEQLTWEVPLSRTVDAIRERAGSKVVVLATGDPMWFGVGVTLARAFMPDEYVILPHVSAFTLAAARLGWPLAEIECLTVHGRPLDLIARHLRPEARLLVLSENGQTPAEVAELLCRHGYGASELVVLSELGSAAESRISGPADGWMVSHTPDLNTIAITCRPSRGDADCWSSVPGLPDHAFRHDGQLTKQPIRAATLAALAPLPGELLWDIGAGSGSVGIEWMRAVPRAKAIAIERDPERIALIRENAAKLGVPDLKIVEGSAPDALADLPPPDAIFIGGGSTGGLFDLCWQALKPGGRLVANVVTLDGEAMLHEWHARLGGEMTRFQVSRAEPVGPYEGWRPLMPVTQLLLVKHRS
jgi:precorrin-6Y C5,15-methyltransferase (decarboxylating)